MNISELTNSDFIQLMDLRRIHINQIVKSRDAFVRQALIANLRRISQWLDMPLPDLALIGKSPDQLAQPEKAA
jgi:hypothetical protein